MGCCAGAELGCLPSPGGVLGRRPGAEPCGCSVRQRAGKLVVRGGCRARRWSAPATVTQWICIQARGRRGHERAAPGLAAGNVRGAVAAHGRGVPRAVATSARARLRPSAYDACGLHVQTYIAPRIGEVALQALTPRRVEALYAELRESGRTRGGGGLAPQTVHNVHRTLSRALSDAVGDRLLESNPALGAHRQPASPEMPTWSAEQLRVFLDHVADDHQAALWRLAATTGIRRGELAGLRWSVVDLHMGRITVVRQRAKGAGTVVCGPTKTRRSRRLGSIDRRTAELLNDHRRTQARRRRNRQASRYSPVSQVPEPLSQATSGGRPKKSQWPTDLRLSGRDAGI